MYGLGSFGQVNMLRKVSVNLTVMNVMRQFRTINAIPVFASYYLEKEIVFNNVFQSL